MPNITINEIAKLAGVSKATVSRVLNNKPDVLPETREKIKSIISEYDFQPNAFAKAITNKSCKTFGVVILNDANYVLSNPYYNEVFRGISIEAKNNGYHLMLTFSEGDDFLSAVKQKRVDGLLLVSPGRNHQKVIEQLRELGTPFVSTSKMPGVNDINFIYNDDYNGACLAIEHLIQLGHRRIGLITNLSVLASSEERLDGYRTTLKKYGIPFDEKIVFYGDTSISSGYESMQKLLREKDVTSVFVAGDLMAAGAISAINEENLRVPEDISIVGFDDIPLAGYLNPPLTTLRQHPFDKGRLAVQMLMDIIEKKYKENVIMKMQVELIIRKSTKSLLK